MIGCVIILQLLSLGVDHYASEWLAETDLEWTEEEQQL